MTDQKTIIAILVAGGRGTRANTMGPKQWEPLSGRRVADWTVAAFQQHPKIDNIVVVHHRDDEGEAKLISGNPTLSVGGNTRAASVQNGLLAAAKFNPTHVMIHDMARPCVTLDIIDSCLAALNVAEAAAPALSVADALWKGADGKVVAPVDRANLFRAQTPQCFAYHSIVQAHETAPTTANDDVEVALAAGIEVTIVEGDENNLKITYPADFARAKKILETL